jgi:hypothetical protein
VTEPNPAHALDFRRFSSDQVARFNAGQVSGDPRALGRADLAQLHGPVLEFDHFALGAEMEIATWDSYPLGFLEDRLEDPPEHKRRYARQGDPDFQAFHHDLYRAVGRGRWWVMEQQPGPVNWAPHNPAPLPGMVRLLDVGGLRPRCRGRLLFPLAAGALRAGADACGAVAPRQRRGAATCRRISASGRRGARASSSTTGRTRWSSRAAYCRPPA